MPYADQGRAVAMPVTFEIYAHPHLRRDYEIIWNENLDEALEINKKKEQQAKKNKKNLKKGVGVNDRPPSNAETMMERDIARIEAKKRKINYMLIDTFAKVDARKPDNIATQGRCDRLLGRAPQSFNPHDRDPRVPFVLVRDPTENAPAFEANLYCSLDVDLVQLMCLWWFFFDSIFAYSKHGRLDANGNPMLAVALTYVVERILRWLRATLGESNLVRKTFTDERFLN